MSTERRRRSQRPFWTGIFSDPWRKLAAVGLALLFWYWLDSTITQTVTKPLALIPVEYGGRGGSDSAKDVLEKDVLELHLPSADYTVVEFQDEVGQSRKQVTITLRGGKQDVADVESNLNYKVELVPFRVRSVDDKYYFTFEIGDIRHKNQFKYQALLHEMEPSSVRVLLEKNSEKKIILSPSHVALSIEDRNLESRVKESVATFSPAVVRLLGPKTALDGIDPKTFLFHATVRPEDVNDTREARVNLSLIDEFEGIRTAGPVFVTYPVEPDWRPEILLKVPVLLDPCGVDAGQAAQFEVSPRVAEEVTIHVTGELKTILGVVSEPVDRERWVLAHARLFVQLTPNHLEQQEPQSEKPTLLLVGLPNNQQFIVRRDFLLKTADVPRVKVRKKKP